MNRKSILAVIGIFFGAVTIHTFSATSVSISVFPEVVTQGEPLMITVGGTKALSEVKSIHFDNNPLPIFLYNKKPTALYGVDLNKKSGIYTAVVTLSDGTIYKKNVTIAERKKIQAPLGIPEKLGGNTTQAERNLVATLAKENHTLASLVTGKKSFWTKPFSYPIANPVVTDSYGYTRLTGASTIAHKGTDFKAGIGTPIRAMNRGVVRSAKVYTAYGGTVVIDHGLGLMSMYMHLSKIHVQVGQLVERGQVIGLSGDTGYAEAPHLHLSLRINNISIDPVKFLELFK